MTKRYGRCRGKPDLADSHATPNRAFGPMSPIDTRSLRYLGGNVLLAVLYASFAYVHWTSFVAAHRPSLILAVLVETTLVLIALTRRAAQAVRRDWETVAVA